MSETSAADAAPADLPAVHFVPVRADYLRLTSWWLVAATVVATPLFISIGGRDMFAEPKELVLRAGGLLVLAALLLRAIFAPRTLLSDLRGSRVPVLLAALAVGWTSVATVFSQNQVLSVWTLLRVALCAVIAIAAVMGVKSQRLEAVYLLIVPAVINNVILLAQAFGIWDPIYPPFMRPVRSALLGNPNWIGSYMLAPTLAVFALVFAFRARRILHLAVALFLAFGLLVTQSMAAIGALAIGLLVMGVMFSWRRAAVVSLLFVLLLVAAVKLDPAGGVRMQAVKDAWTRGDYNRLASNRLTPSGAALLMFRDHPLTGIGPGGYALHYFDYKIRLESNYPVLQQSSDRRRNFGEAHNDHAQMLAVTGLPGYAILLASLIVVGRCSWLARKDPSGTPRAAFAYAFSFALALATAVLMLAQFPLELAASTVTLLYAGALCVGWSGHAEGA